MLRLTYAQQALAQLLREGVSLSDLPARYAQRAVNKRAREMFLEACQPTRAHEVRETPETPTRAPVRT